MCPAGRQERPQIFISNIRACFLKILKRPAMDKRLSSEILSDQKYQGCDVTAEEHADDENVPENPDRCFYKFPVSQTESNELDKTGLPLSAAAPVALLYDDLTQEVHGSFVSSCLLSKTIACLSKRTARLRSSCEEKAANSCSLDYITASSFF